MRYELLLAALLSVTVACHGDKSAEASATAVQPATQAAGPGTNTANAAQIDVPIAAPDVQAKMAQTHAHIVIESDEDRSLNFDLALPKTWKQRDAAGNLRQVLFPGQILATFAANAPGKPGPVVSVVVTPISHDIPLDAWARANFEREGFNVVKAAWFPGSSGLFYDITGQGLISGHRIVRRATLHLDGSRIFTVNTVAPIEAWDENKQNFWVAHLSFEVLNPVGGSAEPQRTAAVKAPAFQVSYPASWSAERAKSGDRDVSGLHLRLPTPDKRDVDAYLLVRAERGPEKSVDALVSHALDMFKKAGVEARGQPRPVDANDDPRRIAVKGWRADFSLPGHMGDADVNLRLDFVRRDNLNFTFAMCQPKFETHPLAALRAQRAFEMARGSLTIP